MKRSLLILGVVLLAIGLTACSGYGTPAPAAPIATTAPAAGPAVVPAAVTAGSLADLGKDVFAANCARCHGANGQGGAGPTLIGSGNALSKYNDAAALLAFESKNMPKSAPGSLSADQYLRVLAFILVQNNFVKADAALDVAKLATISIK